MFWVASTKLWRGNKYRWDISKVGRGTLGDLGNGVFNNKVAIWKVPQCSGELSQVARHKGVGRCTRMQLGLNIRLMTFFFKKKKRFIFLYILLL